MKSPQFALWSEFTPYRELLNSLDSFQRHQCALYLAIHRQRIQDAELFELLRKAEKLGVEVRPWLLLDKKEGYWPNKWNLDAFKKMIQDFLHGCVDQGISVSWIIFDLEPHLELLLTLEKLMQQRKWWQARSLILKWGMELGWRDSHDQIKDLVKWVQEKGIKVQVVTMPMVLDDLKNKKHKLQHYLGIPIEDVPWDEVTFMAYRPYFWDYLPAVSSAIVGSYARDARVNFKGRASLALGPVGSPGMTQSRHFYKTPQELWEDIAAAQLHGISRFSIFSLEGIWEQGELQNFIQPGAGSENVSVDWRSYLIRKGVSLGLSLLPTVDPDSAP